MSDPAQQLIQKERRSLVTKFADKYSIEPNKLLDTLRDTAFRQRNNQPVTNEQMAALLVVADQYGLNPFTKELYAFPQEGGIVPIVGLDGWARIINERGELDGIDFEEVGEIRPIGKSGRRCPEGICCVMYRKDREHPTKVTEWIEECYRDTKPWNDMPRRMLRHKALIQCARVAFGFVGIYDEDEGQRIIEGDVIVVDADGTQHTGGTAGAVNEVLRDTEDVSEADIVQQASPPAPDPEQQDAKPARTESEPPATDQEPGPEDDGGKEATAPADEDAPAKQDDTSTSHLIQCIHDATTVEELDYVRSLNDNRDATPQQKGAITRSIDQKAKRLSEEA